MKIKKISVAMILFAASLVSCGGNKATDNVGTSNSTVNNKEVNTEATDKKSDSTATDLSTPSKAIESFISSSQEQNAEKLSECFSPNCEREFQMIVKKEMKEKDLKEYKEFCTGAKVIEEKIEGNDATVKVKFSRRDEDIKLELVDGKWKIVAF
jgi:membrane-bound lytic murein transglycosylase